MIEKLVHSVKTGEPTIDEQEAAEALKAVANIKPTDAFLEKEAREGDSSDDGDSKPAAKKRSRNKDVGGA